MTNLPAESPISSVTGATDGIALGLGLTNECNLSCAFCYRDPARTDRLSLEQVRSVMERLPVRSVNLGTGENGMHPDFRAILAYLRTQPVKLTITSNGHSIAVLEDSELRAFHDIEFSLDYPTEAEQDAQRGLGNWALIHQQAERCVKLGVPVTIIAVMMKSNYLAPGRDRASGQDSSTLLCASTCIRRCDPISMRCPTKNTGRDSGVCLQRPMSSLSVSRWCERWRVSASSRRLRREHGASNAARHHAALRLLARIGRAAVRFDFDGSGDSEFAAVRTSAHTPEACQPCEFRDSCHGGCAGRRRLQDALLQPDYYCPIVRGERPQLEVRMAASRDLPKMSSSCTTVVIAR